MQVSSLVWRHRLLVMALVMLLCASPGVLAFLLLLAPAPQLPQAYAAVEATRILDRYGRVLYEVVPPQQGSHTYIPLSEIPWSLRQATIATEDATFYRNPGFDILALGRALLQNLRDRRVVAGGSTITQQVVRNLYFPPQERSPHSLGRKTRELILAFRLAQHRSKDDILELYLNQVYYGNLAYGVEAAARTYFGKSARDLDLAEASLLAGLPQAPAAYNPLINLAAAKERQAVVLSLMADAGYIDEAQARAALAEPLRFTQTSFPIEAPHFVAYVRDWLEQELGAERVGQGGLRVHTTLDLDIQAVAESIVRRHIADLRDKDASNAALVALDPSNGQVLAMVGSPDYFDETIDGAVNMAIAPRQPGSAIKPITYAVALSQGYTPATPILDVRTSFLTRAGQPYVPNNYDAIFHGPVSLRYALASSFNVPAVRVMADIGIDEVLRQAAQMGITTLGQADRFDLSLTLGGGEVRLLELTAAYAAFAAGGAKRQPVAVLGVEDAQGNILYEWRLSLDSFVISPQVAYLITDILSDNAARAPGFGWNSPLRLNRPAAVKTGTTSDFRDNWIVGYTPDLVAGVWVGNANNRSMRQTSGVTGAAPIWHDFMEEMLKNSEPKAFPRPEGLVTAEVCEPTGLRPGPWCPERRRELFIAGTEPATTESYYRALTICLPTGLLASPSCPPGQVRERVYAFVPEEAIPWAREVGLPLPPLSPYQPGLPLDASDPLQAGQPLQVALVSPHPESVVEVSREIPLDSQRLVIEALVTRGVPSQVELYQDGSLLASLKDAPYRLTWRLAPGTHTFRAIAYDSQGNKASSQAVRVTVLP